MSCSRGAWYTFGMQDLSLSQILGAITAATAFLLAVLQAGRTVWAKLQEILTEIQHNTDKTLAAEEAAKAVHVAQLNQAELDFLRRFKAAFDTIAPPEWHDQMKAVLGNRKLRASDSELVKKISERYHG